MTRAEQMRKEKRERAEWLSSLKAGDEVVIPGRTWAGSSHEITTIERVTATQLVLPRGRRFNRDDGRIRGTGMSRLEPVTQEVRDDVERGGLHAWLLGLERKPVTLAQLRAMKAAFDGAAEK